MHEKGLQRQKSVGPLVSSQEERALPVPVINRGSTADFVPAFGLHRISLVRASGEAFRRRVFDALEGTRDSCLLGDQFCWHPVLPDPAPPSAGRPDPNCPWYVRILDSTSLIFNVPNKRASQPASREIVHAVVGAKLCWCEGRAAGLGVWGQSGPFPADLTQGPCSVRDPERLGRGRRRIKLLNLTCKLYAVARYINVKSKHAVMRRIAIVRS